MGPLEAFYSKRCTDYTYWKWYEEAGLAAKRARIARVLESNAEKALKWAICAQYAQS